MSGDIELEVGALADTGQHVVKVVRALAGGEPVGAFDLDVADILSKRELLEATVLSSAVTRRSVSVAERPVRTVGQQLFSALFTGAVYGAYRASLGGGARAWQTVAHNTQARCLGTGSLALGDALRLGVPDIRVSAGTAGASCTGSLHC